MEHSSRKHLKRALEDAGYSLSDIARECEVSSSLVSKTIVVELCESGHRTKSAQVELCIAGKLGLDVLELFPDHNPRQNGSAQSVAEAL